VKEAGLWTASAARREWNGGPDGGGTGAPHAQNRVRAVPRAQPQGQAAAAEKKNVEMAGGTRAVKWGMGLCTTACAKRATAFCRVLHLRPKVLVAAGIRACLTILFPDCSLSGAASFALLGLRFARPLPAVTPPVQSAECCTFLRVIQGWSAIPCQARIHCVHAWYRGRACLSHPADRSWQWSWRGNRVLWYREASSSLLARRASTLWWETGRRDRISHPSTHTHTIAW
jgi:hypothetical protein